jgi:hypothetical protein
MLDTHLGLRSMLYFQLWLLVLFMENWNAFSELIWISRQLSTGVTTDRRKTGIYCTTLQPGTTTRNLRCKSNRHFRTNQIPHDGHGGMRWWGKDQIQTSAKTCPLDRGESELQTFPNATIDRTKVQCAISQSLKVRSLPNRRFIRWPVWSGVRAFSYSQILFNESLRDHGRELQRPLSESRFEVECWSEIIQSSPIER